MANKTFALEMKIEPKAAVDRSRLAEALDALAREDSDFGWAADPESDETIVKGLDELHLEGIVEKLLRRHGVGVNAGPLVICYRECLTKAVPAAFVFERDLRGRRGFAVVGLFLQPVEDLQGENAFVSDIAPDPSWDAFVAGAERGVCAAFASGVLAGFPVMNVRAVLRQLEFSDESLPEDFEIAARAAVKNACEGLMALYEPVLLVRFDVPAGVVAMVIAMLHARRVHIREVLPGSTVTDGAVSSVLRVELPVAHTFGLQADFFRFTAGQGSFDMTFLTYAPVPPHVSGDGPENFPPAIGMRA